MKNYQLVKKVNYNSDNALPTSLIDYYLYKEGNERFLVFKFKNNEKDLLKSFKFELTLYDRSSNLLSKELYNIENLEVKELTEFIYEAKIKVVNNFDDLSFELVEAIYETNTWLEGFWLKEITKEQQEEIESREEKLVEKSRVKHFRVKTKAMPFIIPIIFSLIVVFLFAINANKTTTERIEQRGLFEYVFAGSNEIFITDYNGTDLNLYIPRVYEGYIVKGIADNSFQYNYFRSIVFEGDDITIGSNAFAYSLLLTKVTASSFDEIKNYAFAFSSSLKTLTAIRATTISEYSFYQTKRLKPFNMRYGGPFDFDLRMLTPSERAEIPF